MYRVTITYTLKASNRLAAELHTDGICTALRYNKPEVENVEWDIDEWSSGIHPLDIIDPPDAPIASRKAPPKELPRGE